MFRYCDIDLMIVARPGDSSVRNVDIRLHREYSEGCLPDWMVTRFKLNLLQKDSPVT